MNRQDLLKPSGKQSIMINVDGMKCGGCVRAVEQILLEQTNVSNASVNLVTRTALIDLNNAEQPVDHILEALRNRGFPARERDFNLSSQNLSADLDSSENWWSQWRQLMVAIVLLLFSVLGHLAQGGQINLPIIGTLPFHAALATLALVIPGRPILRNGVKSALAFAPSMDTLVGLGVSSAYLASVVALIWPTVGWPCFFNEPVMLLGFVLLGRFLEERARFRTGRSLKELAQLQPDKARLLIGDDTFKEVRVGALQPGDQVQLLAGDRIPVDGIIKKGNSAVDISSLTGEPLPLDASPGTELSSGSLNLESSLIMEVTRVGAETALARIIGLVEEAQSRKAPIQGLADQIAGNFCYGVVSLSAITFFFWWQIGSRLWPQVLNASGQGLLHTHEHGLHASLGGAAETPLGLALQLAIAVLVIACPCALGLATPTVITVASGLAAKHGWLFRGGDVIEMASNIQHIVFDKTGTLTIGRPLVIGVEKAKNQKTMLQLAASIEQNSRHPLANAILQEAQRHKLDLITSISATTYPGQGIEGRLENIDGIIRVGKPEWLQSQGVEMPNDIDISIANADRKGQSLLAVAQQTLLLGIVKIDDQLRSDATLAIDRLRQQGISLSIMSGDRQQTVQRLGEKLGFKVHDLEWELMPNEKLKKLEQRKAMHKPIAMVGDGINDAPALAASDLGIAIGTGTQIAQESADLVLLGDRLEGLPEALLLAHKAMGKIKQNLAWAFGYNLIALPIAAGVLLPSFGLLLSPPIAALLMAISSITVVVNALSLKST